MLTERGKFNGEHFLTEDGVSIELSSPLYWPWKECFINFIMKDGKAVVYKVLWCPR